jgi:hypothetical protein
MAIIQNAVEFNGTIYVSRHRHDFVTIPYGSGDDYYFIDGGLDYHRNNFNNYSYKDPDEPAWDDHGNRFKFLFLSTEDTIDEIKRCLTWGTRGPDRNQTVIYKYIKDLDTDHIEAIFDDVENNRYAVSFLHIYIMQLTLRDRYPAMNGHSG